MNLASVLKFRFRKGTGVRKTTEFWPGNRAERTIIEVRDPWREQAIIEPDHQFGPHGDAATLAANQTHDVGRISTRRHEIDDCDGSARSFYRSFQDEGSATVLPRDTRLRFRGRQQPMAVFI